MAAHAATVVAAIAAVGCSGRPGVERYDLSGTIVYNGKPVPAGYMLFKPDVDNGNSGPGTNADIRGGKYATLAGMGIVGGPHVVTIVGMTGEPYTTPEGITIPVGRPLFPEYEVRVDFPRASGEHDFTVPLKGKK